VFAESRTCNEAGQHCDEVKLISVFLGLSPEMLLSQELALGVELKQSFIRPVIFVDDLVVFPHNEIEAAGS
jgi:hypothetical protein